MTDEQLVAYLDAAHDRIHDGTGASFTAGVESVRVGTIFAHDAKQYHSWRADVSRRSGHAPTGKNLAQLARDFGGQVTAGEFEFRN